MRFLLENWDYVCPCLCFILCLLHSIVTAIVSARQSKKIEKLCDKCGMPVYSDMSHICIVNSNGQPIDISNSQLVTLADVISGVKKDD